MCFSLFLAVLPLGTPGDDRLLAALLGGGISGVGLGLVIRAGGSTGGTDLLGSLFCGGVGKYSKERKKVLLCVVKKKELTKALGLIKECDERAFVIIGDAREVRGEGFTSL